MTGFEAFMKNPSWKEIYDNAPTEFLKEYYKFEFNTDPEYYKGSEEEYLKKLREFREKFTKEEWQYLIDTTENIIAKIEYSKIMKKALGI